MVQRSVERIQAEAITGRARPLTPGAPVIASAAEIAAGEAVEMRRTREEAERAKIPRRFSPFVFARAWSK